MAHMPSRHSKATIVSMAVIAIGTTALLHEGVGHGVTAWLRGDVPTELTSNHLSSLHEDRWVQAGGTLVNLAAGVFALISSHLAGNRANLRYFCWLLAAKNLFSGAGYFMFSGIIGFGDWQQVILGLPHQALWRTSMAIFGAALYALFARLLAISIRPFIVERREYNVVGRLPYLAACIFSCLAGLFDPLGLKLLLVSTIPAAFGGSSGMLWLDSLMPRTPPSDPLAVRRSPSWWVAGLLFGVAYILILGRGIEFEAR
jgi:hypothetical protein